MSVAWKLTSSRNYYADAGARRERAYNSTAVGRFIRSLRALIILRPVLVARRHAGAACRMASFDPPWPSTAADSLTDRRCGHRSDRRCGGLAGLFERSGADSARAAGAGPGYAGAEVPVEMLPGRTCRAPVSLPWRDLLAAVGKLLPGPLLRARLAAAGVRPDRAVVACCTGGVRSGWVTTVLNDLGIPARNYAGSMWEWAAGDPAELPLVPGR